MPRNSSQPTPLTISLAVAASLAAWTPNASAQTAAANSAAPAMDAWTSLLEAPKADDEGASIISAQVIEGSPETELVLSGEAEVRRAGTVITGDNIVYTQATGEVTVEGDAVIVREGAKFNAPKFSYFLDTETGRVDNVDYEYAPRGLRGSAGCAEFKSADVTELSDVVVTSCKKDSRAWWIEMDSLTLDEYTQSGEGTGAVLKMGGVPVLGLPWFTFPLSAERKSGFLTPAVGASSARGFDLSVPYYFNIAPNYDYTLTPRIMSQRGFMLGNEFRFLSDYLEGEVGVQYMPNDRKTGEDRYSIQTNLKGAWNGFGYGVNYNRVSDDDYLDDFSSTLRDNSDDILAQDYWLTYGKGFWNTAVRVTKNQTLRDTDKPYEREPQFTWSAYLADEAGFELTTKIDATRFAHPTKLDGDRFVFHQTVAYPIQRAGWFVTPKAQFISTKYNLTHAMDNHDEANPSVTVPILSLDSGMVFERDTNLFSRDITQTLEPRIFYSYTPYRDQSGIPLFDSSIADVNFAQLMTENTWAGYDRIPETNQVTGMVTTRLVDAESGMEWLRAAIGQRYYFNDKTLDSDGNRISMGDQKSDFLASIGARLTREIQANAYAQWSWDRSSMQKAVAGIRWQPRPMSVIGLYYRYNWAEDEMSDDNIDQIDLSLQWPLTEKLFALARQNYSLYDKKFIETLVGFEYHADCWTVRAVAQRYTRDTDSDETNFYIQLELTGLGAIGSSPLAELERSIQGYQTRSPVPTSMGKYDYYY